MKTKSKTCGTCYFNDSIPGVAIGDGGSCTLCASAREDPRLAAGTTGTLAQLREIAETVKKERRGKYDCIIGASGGLDSSYVTYVAKRVLGLNPLLVNYDHGLVKDTARQNLENLAQRLGVDIVWAKSEKKLDLLFVKHFLKAFEKTGMFWGMCT